VAKSTARRVEEQGRLFWAWLLTLPIIALFAASWVFGAPWPSRMRLHLALVGLAFPVVFVVGEPLFRNAVEARRRGALNLTVLLATATVVGYVSGIVALLAPIPSLAGVSAVVVSTYLSLRYLLNWD